MGATVSDELWMLALEMAVASIDSKITAARGGDRLGLLGARARATDGRIDRERICESVGDLPREPHERARRLAEAIETAALAQAPTVPGPTEDGAAPKRPSRTARRSLQGDLDRVLEARRVMDGA